MIDLVEIDQQGGVCGAEAPQGLPKEVADANAGMYATVGFNRPWIGYLIRQQGEFIGTCGFKGRPVNQRVEIAYFTFPEHQGQGVATAAARHLIELAQNADPAILICARTLPEENASTRILRKLGFTLHGSVQDPEDGEVWEWWLPKKDSDNA